MHPVQQDGRATEDIAFEEYLQTVELRAVELMDLVLDKVFVIHWLHVLKRQMDQFVFVLMDMLVLDLVRWDVLQGQQYFIHVR